MAQRPTSDFNIDPNTTSGTDLANILNRMQDALDSGNSGGSRPAYLAAGGLWVKEGDPMELYLYDGTSDQLLFDTVNGVPDSGGGLEEAPEDGALYGRQSGAWAEVVIPEQTDPDWSDVQNKPAEFPPEAHTQGWDTITDKPADYPPSAHNHDGVYASATHNHDGAYEPAGTIVICTQAEYDALTPSSDSVYFIL